MSAYCSIVVSLQHAACSIHCGDLPDCHTKWTTNTTRSKYRGVLLAPCTVHYFARVLLLYVIDLSVTVGPTRSCSLHHGHLVLCSTFQVPTRYLVDKFQSRCKRCCIHIITQYPDRYVACEQRTMNRRTPLVLSASGFKLQCYT